MTAHEVPPWQDVATSSSMCVFRDGDGRWWKVITLGVRIRDVYRGNEDGSDWSYAGRIRVVSSEPRRLRAAIERARLAEAS